MKKGGGTKVSNRSRGYGLFLLRVGLGIMFILHGFPKLLGGPPAWERLGSTMALVGVDFMPVFWGLLAAVTEAVGGGMLVVGLFTPLASFALSLSLIMALAFNLNTGATFEDYSHPLELLIVTMSLILIGPGKVSIDYLLFPERTSKNKPELSEERTGFVLS